MANKILSFAVIVFLFIISFSTLANITFIDNTYCTQTGLEPSSWNVSELIPNGTLMQNWSKLAAADNWAVSTNLSDYWIGNTTLSYNVNDKTGNSFSACFVNWSKFNRSQSLVWSHVESNQSNANYVYTGVVYAFYNYTNFSMILYGNNKTFLFDYLEGTLYNTEDHTYGDHGGMVILENTDTINYWDNWTDINPRSANGIYMKTIYNSYCGSLQSKYWNGTPTLVQEPVGWHVEKNIDNITTDQGVCFGIATWNPTDYSADNYTVHFDYINNWRLNYTLNYSASINVGGVLHPRPHMEFPVINMDAVGDNWWNIIMPNDYGGIEGNITNDTISNIGLALTNQFNLEARAFTKHTSQAKTYTSAYDQSDTVYYYSATLTNFTDWYITFLASLPIEYRDYYPGASSFSNNYLMVYIQQCEDGQLSHDYSTLGIDVDDDGSYDANDRFFEWDDWGTVVSWTGSDLDVSIMWDGSADFTESAYAFMWRSEYDAPHNLHRYNKHVHSICLIPLWTLVKSDGSYLNNTDTFGLHIATYNIANDAFCVWENWNETDCSTFFDESDYEGIAETYWNSSGVFTDGCAGVHGEDGTIDDCLFYYESYCWKMYHDNETELWNCFTSAYEYCLQQYCTLNIPDSSIAVWGEGQIPLTPSVNSSSGRYDSNVSLNINISYVSPENASTGIDINITVSICNSGDEALTDIILNLTWDNCSCSDWKFNLTSTNITISNITYYNDSCYLIANITNLTAGMCYDLWMNINITECAADTYGYVYICGNITSDVGIDINASDCDWIEWGLKTTSVRILGNTEMVDTFSIAAMVFTFTGLCLIIGALIALVAVIKVYGGF